MLIIRLNIVHQDLKLTLEITILNFGFCEHVLVEAGQMATHDVKMKDAPLPLFHYV